MTGITRAAGPYASAMALQRRRLESMLPVLDGTGTSVSAGNPVGSSTAISLAANPVSSPRLSAQAIRRVSASSLVIGRDLGDTYRLAAIIGGTRNTGDGDLCPTFCLWEYFFRITPFFRLGLGIEVLI
jgi:hypothetical protein